MSVRWRFSRLQPCPRRVASSEIWESPETHTTSDYLRVLALCPTPLQELAALALGCVATRAVLISFEPLPLPQPRVRLRSSLAVHFATDEVFVRQTRV